MLHGIAVRMGLDRLPTEERMRPTRLATCALHSTLTVLAAPAFGWNALGHKGRLQDCLGYSRRRHPRKFLTAESPRPQLLFAFGHRCCHNGPRRRIERGRTRIVRVFADRRGIVAAGRKVLLPLSLSDSKLIRSALIRPIRGNPRSINPQIF
jgi:hypothetical protein